MKARVYGHCLFCFPTLDRYEYSFFNGEIVVCDKKYKDFQNFIYNGKTFSCHQKQLILINEITITEEEFDTACRKSLYTGFEDEESITLNMVRLKKELFKDVK